MPHLYTNTHPAKPAKPKHPVKPLDHPLPDPFLPLIVKDASSAFTLANGQQGRVHPQRMDKDNSAHHRFLFYVEFPAASADYRQIDIRRILAIHGLKAPSHGMRHAETAMTLASIPAALFPQILKAAAP